MKKLLILFSVLLIAFMGVWVFKSKTPVNRPDDSAAQQQQNTPWWENGTIPTADSDWILDPEIPENYIPVPGEDELYMVVDDSGTITEYRHRTKQDDGSWVWETVNPDIPDNYEKVEGLENVYKVTNTDGTVSYYKYVRNSDDTFAFIPVDANGKELEQISDNSTIPDNYIHVSGNVYAVYNEHGVLIGYKERKIDADGNYYWVDCDKPADADSGGTTGGATGGNTGGNTGGGTGGASGNGSGGTGGGTGGSTGGNTGGSTGGNVIQGSDGTYTQTETIISTETIGGWTITYQTVVTRTYMSDGTLQSTKKDGPTEISRVKASDSGGSAPDQSKIAPSLSAEYARVNVGLTYDASLANSVLAQINAERVNAGKSSLSMTSSSDAYKLAATRAADMAIYNHSDYDSPMYGTLSEMCSRFNVGSQAPTELVWKTSAGKTAEAVASRLQIMSDGALSNGSYQSVGLSIVSKGGYYYINMVLLG